MFSKNSIKQGFYEYKQGVFINTNACFTGAVDR